jgi:cell division protein FtsB
MKQQKPQEEKRIEIDGLSDTTNELERTIKLLNRACMDAVWAFCKSEPEWRGRYWSGGHKND